MSTLPTVKVLCGILLSPGTAAIILTGEGGLKIRAYDLPRIPKL